MKSASAAIIVFAILALAQTAALIARRRLRNQTIERRVRASVRLGGAA